MGAVLIHVTDQFFQDVTNGFNGKRTVYDSEPVGKFCSTTKVFFADTIEKGSLFPLELVG